MLEIAVNQTELVLAALAALGIIFALTRKVARKWKATASRTNLAFETLLGRDEVLHPETGVVVVEATPPLGMRFARMEEAIVKMSETTAAVSGLSVRVECLGDALTQHITDCDESRAASQPVTVINNPA